MLKRTPNVIVVLRLISAVPFAVYYSSLLLYLLSINFPKELAISLEGSVLALSYGSSLIGGYIAERYLNLRSFFLFSCVCQAIGCLVFTVTNPSYIIWFCSLFLLGCAGETTCLNMMLTRCFKPDDYNREKSFFWFYMFLNTGYLLGFFLAGYLGKIHEYKEIPIIIFVFLILNVTLCLKLLDKKVNVDNKNHIFLFLLIANIAFFIFRFCLQYSQFINAIIILAWIIFGTFMLFKLLHSHSENKNKILTFYFLLVSALIFWSAYFLGPMALIIFIQKKVNLIIFNFVIAPQWFQNINSLVVILGTAWLGFKYKVNHLNSLAIIKQFSFGLFSIGLGFAVLALGIFLTPINSKVGIIWIVLSYIFQSIGELLIAPIGYALIGRFIPTSHQSLMTGVWVTLFGVAGAISSILSRSSLIPNPNSKLSLFAYGDFFLYISIVTTSVFLLIYLVASGQKQILFISKKIFNKTAIN